VYLRHGDGPLEGFEADEDAASELFSQLLPVGVK